MSTDAADSGAAGLGPGGAAIVRRAHEATADGGHATLGVNHWLLAVVSRNARMAESLADGLSPATLKPWTTTRRSRRARGSRRGPS